MADLSCLLEDILTDQVCASKGGLLTVFWTDLSNVDWEAMAQTGNYDPATRTVKSWAMLGGSWGELQFEALNGRLDALYTDDNGYYEVSLLNMLFEGKTKERTISIARAISCCGLLLQVHDNNDQARVFGKEPINGSWFNPLVKAKISRHSVSYTHLTLPTICSV